MIYRGLRASSHNAIVALGINNIMNGQREEDINICIQYVFEKYYWNTQRKGDDKFVSHNGEIQASRKNIKN